MTRPLVLPLGGGGLPPGLVGGKGAWLDRVIAEGFPVPPCAVLTTECYDAVARQEPIADLLGRRQVRSSSPDRSATEERLLDDAFLAAPLPAHVTDAIRDAVALVTAGGATRLAVRSSATAEDMGTMSFAGQYRSYLDVGTERELIRAVRLVWASLWQPAPTAYRRFQGVDEAGLAMAVVLMPMVPAECAGVAFSLDPEVPDSVRVEAVAGLGEGLVSGSVTPQVTRIPRLEACGPRHADDTLEVQVARLTLRVEAALGQPQDIEWAWDGSMLTLLQARPIAIVTRRRDDGFDTPTPDGARWTTAGIAETLPGVLPPLRWATAGFILEEAFRRLFDELEVLPELPPPATIIGRFRARAALSLDVLEQMATAIPGGRPEDVERQYFGLATGDRPVTVSTPANESRWRTARHDLAMLSLRRRSSREAEIVMAATSPVVRADTSGTATLEAVLRLRHRLLDLAGRAMAAEVAVAASATASYRHLESWLLRRFDQPEAERWAQRLTAHRGSAEWWRPSAAEVAALSRDDLLPHDAVGWDVARERLLATPRGAALHDALLEAARCAGSMAVFGGPCWDEDLDHMWDLVWTASQVGAQHPTGDAARRREILWDEFTRVLSAVPSGPSPPGQLVDRRLLTARRLVDVAVELLDRRESTKTATLALGGQLRRVHLELGRRLTVDDRLDRPEDVELLDEGELHAALAGRCPSRAELGRRRRWLEQCAAEEPLPERFRGRPTAQRVVRPTGTELHGWAAGAGVFTGVARVVREPTDELHEGEVLVATSTDASWSPLFMRAGAIAVERGGPLSHAAIVARELGIPAVLNVPGLVASFDDDGAAVVTVDGDRGLVAILDADAGGGPDEARVAGRRLDRTSAP
ncbi:PEP/pyruvate-binding domain-containing protein [Knoellia aerolata]|uniref:Phosphoenolpyruvate synthase n=1 Tax=Knoellia aerolata DSM 18566 TaxID=1385519 RepID=A0A0A0JYT4_9MICO|nr:PEP/pyruvate-binding domain-containing protein [Knoellia aerolata]KGN40706.1 hypothetical protein N801_12795 [Knoellia aerolata DSM 18566]